MTRHLTPRPSNRHCEVVKTSSFSLPRIREEIRRRDGVQRGFGLIDTGLAAGNETLFKVYDNGKDLLLAICALTAPGDEAEGGLTVGQDSFEIVFDPYHDHVGFVQLVFVPRQEVATYHHLPYPEAQSTAFPELRVKKVSWESGGRTDSSMGWGLCAEQWLFVRLAAEEVFRNGSVCGFNVVRTWLPEREHSSWNLTSGVGFQDATGLGHLYREPAAGQLSEVAIRSEAGVVTIDAKVPHARRVTASLVDPHGTEVPLAISASGASWRAAAELDRALPGRYRLYPRRGKKPCEPEYVAFDRPSRKNRRPFTVGLTVDIVDDVIMASYTPEGLQAEMDLYASSGIGRIYWIDYTPPWLQSHKELPELVRNARKSERQCGDLLHAGVEAAHKAGMEVVGIYKPYDLANRAEPTECTMRPHPEWFREPHGPITSLRIYSTDRIDVSKKPDVRLWVSDDNVRYRPYRGSASVSLGRENRPHYTWSPGGNLPEDRSCRNWYLELSGLAVRSPYLAIEFPPGELRLTHRAHALVEARDEEGQLVSVFPSSGGSRKGGFCFWEEWPTWRNRSARLLERMNWGPGTHAVSFRPPPSAPGLLEPAFEVVRENWLGRVRRLVQAGADAVDIRTLCHHNGLMDYMVVAFSEPVRAAFREMYGREATPSWEDCERVRRLRGDFYTDFMRRGSEIVRTAGRKFITHLECGLEVPPGLDQRMQIYLDWESWLREGLLDEITLKWWSSQNPYIHERVLPLAHKLGVAVHICDRNSSLTPLRGGERAERLCGDARKAGFDGLLFYEACNYKYWTPFGQPELLNHVKEAFVRAAAASRARKREPR